MPDRHFNYIITNARCMSFIFYYVFGCYTYSLSLQDNYSIIFLIYFSLPNFLQCLKFITIYNYYLYYIIIHAQQKQSKLFTKRLCARNLNPSMEIKSFPFLLHFHTF